MLARNMSEESENMREGVMMGMFLHPRIGQPNGTPDYLCDYSELLMRLSYQAEKEKYTISFANLFITYAITYAIYLGED